MKLKARHFPVILLTFLVVFTITSRSGISFEEIFLLFKEVPKKPLWFLFFLEGLYFLNYGLLSKTLLRLAGTKISLKETIKVGILWVLGFQMAPFVGGAILVYLFYKKLSVPSSNILFLVGVLSIFSWLNFLFFSFLAALLLPQSLFSLFPERIILTFLFALLAVLALGFLFLRNRGEKLTRVLCLLIKPLNEIGSAVFKKEISGQEKVEIVIEEFLRDLDLLLRNPRKSLLCLGFSTISYLLNVGLLYFSFFIFGYLANPFLLILGFSVSSLLSLASLFPEAPGVMEASLVTVFVNLGFPVHQTFLAALLYRLSSFWLPLPLGFLIYLGLNGYLTKLKNGIFNNFS